MGFRVSPESKVDFNLVFMGTAAFAVPTLGRLHEEGYRLSAVITQPDKPVGRGRSVQTTPVGRAALERGLTLYRPNTLRDDHARVLFEQLAPHLIVVVAYGKIIPPWLIALPRHGVINLHGSLLPKYRGAAPIQWAMANGETETGACTMQIDAGLDTGPCYLCESTPIGLEESVQELTDRLAGIGSGLTARTIEGIREGSLRPTPQDENRASVAPILKKEDGVIDWNTPAAAIHNRVRAFNPWPGTVSSFRGAVCKILQSKVVSFEAGGEAPGTIVEFRKALIVACGDGQALEILKVQPENRGPISGIAFANGRRIVSGEKFERVSDRENR